MDVYQTAGVSRFSYWAPCEGWYAVQNGLAGFVGHINILVLVILGDVLSCCDPSC